MRARGRMVERALTIAIVGGLTLTEMGCMDGGAVEEASASPIEIDGKVLRISARDEGFPGGAVSGQGEAVWDLETKVQNQKTPQKRLYIQASRIVFPAPGQWLRLDVAPPMQDGGPPQQQQQQEQRPAPSEQQWSGRQTPWPVGPRHLVIYHRAQGRRLPWRSLTCKTDRDGDLEYVEHHASGILIDTAAREVLTADGSVHRFADCGIMEGSPEIGVVVLPSLMDPLPVAGPTLYGFTLRAWCSRGATQEGDSCPSYPGQVPVETPTWSATGSAFEIRDNDTRCGEAVVTSSEGDRSTATLLVVGTHPFPGPDLLGNVTFRGWTSGDPSAQSAQQWTSGQVITVDAFPNLGAKRGGPNENDFAVVDKSLMFEPGSPVAGTYTLCITDDDYDSNSRHGMVRWWSISGD